MKRHARTFIVLGVAIVTAALSAAAVYRAVRRIPERRVEIITARAVVAARPLSPGVLLTADDVKLVPWPAASPVEGGYSQIDQVLGRGVLSPLAVNEPLTGNTVATPGAGAGLPPSIPNGMRAISLKVNEVIGVAGFVVPGTHVDVVVVVNKQGTKEESSMARAVVSDVLVLTAGTRYDQAKSKELTSIRNAAQLANDLEQRGCRAQTHIILNRLDGACDIAPRDVERTVGRRILHVLPSDYRRCLDALNKGRPLVLAGSGKLAGAIAKMAHDLADVREQPGVAARGLFERFTSRPLNATGEVR